MAKQKIAKSRAKRDGRTTKRSAQPTTTYYIVAFAPEDLQIPVGSADHTLTLTVEGYISETLTPPTSVTIDVFDAAGVLDGKFKEGRVLSQVSASNTTTLQVYVKMDPGAFGQKTITLTTTNTVVVKKAAGVYFEIR